MNIIKKLLSLLLPFFKLSKNISQVIFNTPSLTILTFHDIPPEKIEDFDHFITRLQISFTFITPQELKQAIHEKKKLPKNALLITFDDGFKSTYQAWQKVLKPKSIKSAFFICPSFIGLDQEVENYVSKNLFMGGISPSEVKHYQYPMTKDEILELQESGNEISCHSMTHKNLASLTTSKERQQEIVESKNILENFLNKKIRWFAYPFGAIQHINAESLKLISKNYDLCFSNVRGTNFYPLKPFGLRRQNIDIHSPLKDQEYIIWGGLNPLYHKKRKRLDALLEKS